MEADLAPAGGLPARRRWLSALERAAAATDRLELTLLLTLLLLIFHRRGSSTPACRSR